MLAKYIRSRVKRLVVPLVFGMFVVIAPLQVYLERLSHRQFTGSFLEFYPHYFDGWFGFGGNFAWMGIHLWYLEVLIRFFSDYDAGVCLPQGRNYSQIYFENDPFFKKPGVIFLLAVPIAIMEFVASLPLLRHTILGTKAFGGWSILPYLVFFTLGYIIASDLKFGLLIEKQRIAALITGVCITAIGFFLFESGYPLPGWLLAILRSLNAWAWLIAILVSAADI